MVSADNVEAAIDKAKLQAAKLWGLYDPADPGGGYTGVLNLHEVYNIHFHAFAIERAMPMHKLLHEIANIGYENYETPQAFFDYFAAFQKRAQEILTTVK